MGSGSAMIRSGGRKNVLAFLTVAAGLLVVQTAALLAMGHPPICACGVIRLWVGSVTSPENSQQLTDWYSFSHVIHGFILYAVVYALARPVWPSAPFGLRLTTAIGVEVAWEILENSPWIIDRYRQQALAQGYFGDSVLNSLSDTAFAVLGFVLARGLPVWATVALALAMELFVGWMIRDNLTLNVIQLIHPSAAISRWQSGS
jgi:hypothetical protein